MHIDSEFWRRKGALDVIYITGEHEPVRFGTIKDHEIDVSEPTLSTRLDELVQSRLLTREEYDRSPRHVEYSLTPEGADLYERLVPFFEWDGMDLRCPDGSDTETTTGVAGSGDRPESGETAKSSPAETEPAAVDADDGRDRPGSQRDERPSAGTEPPFEAFDVVVDVVFRRGAVQILEICHHHDALRFGEIRDHLDVGSTSTIADRLEQLEDVGVIHRQRYDESPPRVEYSLTPSGEQLYEGLGPVFELLGEGDTEAEASGEPQSEAAGEP